MTFILILILCTVITDDLVLQGIYSRHHTSKIIGGHKTTIEKHPFQIAIIVDSNPICGGSIINELYILTAAHCIFASSDRIFIHAGSTVWNTNYTLRGVVEATIHPLYEDQDVLHDYDAGLLRMDKPLEMSSKIKKIHVAEPYAEYTPNLNISVTGWGSLKDDALHEVMVPIVEQAICKKAYPNRITDRMFCAGFMEDGGKDACYGDSGGPAVINAVQYGIVSWGTQCALKQYPGVYVKVSTIRSWLAEVAGI